MPCEGRAGLSANTDPCRPERLPVSVVREQITLAGMGSGELGPARDLLVVQSLAMRALAIVGDVQAAVRLGIGGELLAGLGIGEEVEAAVVGGSEGRIARGPRLASLRVTTHRPPSLGR